MKKELKQSKFYYSLVKTIAGFLARFKFKRKFINNDIKVLSLLYATTRQRLTSLP